MCGRLGSELEVDEWLNVARLYLHYEIDGAYHQQGKHYEGHARECEPGGIGPSAGHEVHDESGGDEYGNQFVAFEPLHHYLWLEMGEYLVEHGKGGVERRTAEEYPCCADDVEGDDGRHHFQHLAPRGVGLSLCGCLGVEG